MPAFFDTKAVIGVLNATPDSFSDGGRFVRGTSELDLSAAIDIAAGLVRDGADLIDVGGESTRPGAREVSIDLECTRTAPLIEAMAKRFPTPLSIDTRKAPVAEAAMAAGARIVNDVSGLRFDPTLAKVAAEAGATVIVGHARGTPETMQDAPHYDSVIEEVAAELRASLAVAREASIDADHLVIDPGIGFGKRAVDNHVLLTRIASLRAAVGGDFPIVVGPSRKAFLGKLTGDDAAERDTATVAACAIAFYEGADAVRVHDVAGAVRARAIGTALRAARGEGAL